MKNMKKLLERIFAFALAILGIPILIGGFFSHHILSRANFQYIHTAYYYIVCTNLYRLSLG